MSDPQKTPETLESLAQKLAFTQKTLEAVKGEYSNRSERRFWTGLAIGVLGILAFLFTQGQSPATGALLVIGFLIAYLR